MQLMCRVFCQFLMFMPSVVFNLTWAFNPLSTKLPFNACSITLCLHKVRTEKWIYYKICACMEGGGSTKDKIFFLMMLLEPYKRKELLSGCTWQLLAVAKGCCWFSISVEAFSDKALSGSNSLSKKYTKNSWFTSIKETLRKIWWKQLP